MQIADEKQEEKEQLQIKVNSEYEALIDPLLPNEYASLRESIREHGQLVPGIVNQYGEILDAHHRYKACKETGKPFSYKIRVTSGKLEDIKIIFESNANRRHWTMFQKGKHALRYQPHFEEIAKKNMSLGGKGSKYLETFHVDKELSKLFGISTASLHNARKAINLTDENPSKELLFGYDSRSYSDVRKALEANKITLSKACTILKRDQAITSVRAETKAHSVSLGLSENSNNNKLRFLNKELYKNRRTYRDQR
jgi:hypothetical protein